MPDDFERMWADLAPIGRSAASGGYFRQPFTTPERELDAWFTEQAEARGLRVERDEIGNVVAWWDSGTGPGVLASRRPKTMLPIAIRIRAISRRRQPPGRAGRPRRTPNSIAPITTTPSATTNSWRTAGRAKYAAANTTDATTYQARIRPTMSR